MADSIEEKMKYLSKRYGFLNRGKGGVIWDKLNSVLESFLSGNTLVAYSDFYNLFQENISEMRKCTIHIKDEFYRMRKGENAMTEYTNDKDMGHIPFELNHLVGNERYSMSGIPSLYLSSSLYTCWEELHRPHFEYASCALFKAQEDFLVLDLTNQEHYHFTDSVFSDCLTLACSLQVSHPTAPFKSEYIIPQILLQSLVRYNKENVGSRILGIKYTSIHVKDKSLWVSFPENKKNKKLFFNYVFPAFDRKPNGTSDRLNKLFQFWNSITYNKVKLMTPDYKVNSPNNRYQESMFGIMEDRLKNMNVYGMLQYDSNCPKGALTF